MERGRREPPFLKLGGIPFLAPLTPPTYIPLIKHFQVVFVFVYNHHPSWEEIKIYIAAPIPVNEDIVPKRERFLALLEGTPIRLHMQDVKFINTSYFITTEGRRRTFYSCFQGNKTTWEWTECCTRNHQRLHQVRHCNCEQVSHSNYVQYSQHLVRYMVVAVLLHGPYQLHTLLNVLSTSLKDHLQVHNNSTTSAMPWQCSH